MIALETRLTRTCVRRFASTRYEVFEQRGSTSVVTVMLLPRPIESSIVVTELTVALMLAAAGTTEKVPLLRRDESRMSSMRLRSR